MGFAKSKKTKTDRQSEPDPEAVSIVVSGACMAAIEFMMAQSWGMQRIANWMALTDRHARRRDVEVDWRIVEEGSMALLGELQRVQDIIETP